MTQEEFFKRYSFNVREDKIGGGSFGTVYRAYDNVLDREVAVKVSEVRISGDKEFSLKAEFKAIEKLPAHANIANYEEVHTFESFNGVFDYAIMQYYPLGNLDHFLSKNELDVVKRETLVLAILNGISHLHRHHIVQRDLKPSNILVVDRKGKLIPKITDFGLSKQANADNKASRFTNSFAGGTLQYCSPEQIKGLPLKLNTDLWSFGAIAYEIFTGKALFEVEGSTSASAEWQNEVSKKILHEDYSAKLVQLPGNWPAVVAACLERDMNKRVKNAEDLLKILKGETSNEDIAATQILPQADNNATQILFSKEPPSRTEESGQPAPETVMEKLKTNTSPKTNHPEKPETKTTIPKPKKSHKRVWIGVAAGLIAAVAMTYGFTLMDNSEQMDESSKVMADPPILFKKDSLFGYKLKNRVVIAPKYKMANRFEGDRAKVQTKDSVFYIDTKGDWVASYSEKNEKEAIADNSATEKEENGKEKLEEDNNSDNKAAVEKLSLAEQKRIYEQAKILFKNNEDDKVISILEPPAKQGYTKAQTLLGKALLGKYIITGYNKYSGPSKFWLEKATRNGSREAQMYLGIWYQGIDSEKSEQYYLNAAERGYLPAYKKLIDLYDYRNPNETLKSKWQLKLAKAGDHETMYDIAWDFYKYKKDYKKAAYWFEKSALAGNRAAMGYISSLYEKGLGVEKNLIIAKKWDDKYRSLRKSTEVDLDELSN